MYESRIDLSEGIRPLEERASESHLRVIASALGTLAAAGLAVLRRGGSPNPRHFRWRAME